MSKKHKKKASGQVNNVEAVKDTSWLEIAKEVKEDVAKSEEEMVNAEAEEEIKKEPDKAEDIFVEESLDDGEEETKEDAESEAEVESETEVVEAKTDENEINDPGDAKKETEKTGKGLKAYFGRLDEERKEKLIKNIGYGICGFFVLSIILLVVMVTLTGFIPGLYISLFAIVLLLLAGLFAILQEWFIPGMVGKILAVFLGVIFVVGSVYLGKTYYALKNITGFNFQTSTIRVYSLKEAHISEIGDTNDAKYGILLNTDRENTNKVLSELSLKIDYVVYGYNTVLELVNALKTGEVDAIVLNEAYLSIASSIEELNGITEELNALYEVSIKTRVTGSEELTLPPMITATPVPTPTPAGPTPTLEPGVTATPTPTDTPTPTPYTGLAYTFDGMLVDKSQWVYGNKNVFTAYLSGIDTYGPPNTASRSDVNILCVVNMNTHRILMINTPRDYYVVLSGAGMRDKLTHAGAYGIQTSINTLQNLYGVSIDYYAKVNFTGFMTVIDALGGVDVESDYEFYQFKKGVNHMNGEAALTFARERYYLPGGDRARGKNQMAVITAIIKKLISTDALANFDALLASLSNCVVTNMEYSRMAELVRTQIGYGGGWDIVSYSVNGSDGWDLCYALGGANYVMIPKMDTLEAGRQKIRNMYWKGTVD